MGLDALRQGETPLQLLEVEALLLEVLLQGNFIAELPLLAVGAQGLLKLVVVGRLSSHNLGHALTLHQGGQQIVALERIQQLGRQGGQIERSGISQGGR
jgi:hypothetical protein